MNASSQRPGPPPVDVVVVKPPPAPPCPVVDDVVDVAVASDDDDGPAPVVAPASLGADTEEPQPRRSRAEVQASRYFMARTISRPRVGVTHPTRAAHHQNIGGARRRVMRRPSSSR